MNIVSWNVNGIRAIAKKDFFDDLIKINPDILCLQETKAQTNEVESTLADMVCIGEVIIQLKKKVIRVRLC